MCEVVVVFNPINMGDNSTLQKWIWLKTYDIRVYDNYHFPS